MPQITQLAEVFTSQLFWLAVVFGLIFLGIGRGMIPKIRSPVDARDAQVADDLERAKAARAAAEDTEAEWRARMDTARVEGARIAQQAMQKSSRESEARVQVALNQIDAKVAEARLRIRAAVEAARPTIEAAAVEAAQQMVERLIGLKIDSKDAAQAVASEFELLGGASRRKAASPPAAERRVASRGR